MAVSRKNNDAPKGASKEKFGPVVQKIDRARQDQKDASADVGNAYQNAETWGFNRVALKLAIKVRDMEAAKRHDFLSSLNTYLDWMGVNDQGELFGDAPTGVGANGASDAAQPNENVANTQGRQAGLAGARNDTNPHPINVKNHDAWQDGWLDGQAEAVRRNIKPIEADTETHANT